MFDNEMFDFEMFYIGIFIIEIVWQIGTQIYSTNCQNVYSDFTVFFEKVGLYFWNFTII